MSLKAYLQTLISKLGVVRTAGLITETGEVTGIESTAHERRVSFIAPHSGYVVVLVKFDVSIVHLMINEKSFTQIAKDERNGTYQAVCAPCAKGDTVEVAVLAHANGGVQFNFFPINNGK